MSTRDAQTKGGSLESGTTHKSGIGGLPGKDAIMKATQRPPQESNKAAARGHKLRTNTQGY